MLAGVRLRSRPARSRSPPPTWSCRCARRCPPSVEGDGAIVVPGKLLVDLARLLPDDGGRDRAQAPTKVSCTSRRGATRRGSTSTAPRTSHGCRPSTCRCTEIDRASLLETVASASRVGLSRDESRPVLTGILVRFEGTTLTMAATDSYRLSVKETQLGDRRPGAGGDHPGARARRAGADRLRTPTTIQLGVHENHVVFGCRRHVADDAAHRRAVPEHQAAAARDVRGGARTAAHRAARRRPARRGDGPAQRPAAPALRRGRADGLRAEPGRRRDAGVDARRRTPASRSRSGSTPSSCARGSSRSADGTAVRLKLINPLRPGLITAEGDAFWYLIMPIRLAG